MKLSKKQKIWGIILILTAVLLLLYFYKQPYHYSGKIRKMNSETNESENIGKMEVRSRTITEKDLTKLKGREVITYSSEVKLTQQKIDQWKERKRNFHLLDITLNFQEEKLPFKFEQVEKVEVRIFAEYTYYEADGNFFGQLDLASGKLIGKDGKPLILLLNYDIFSHKNNWKVLCDISFKLKGSEDWQKGYEYYSNLKGQIL